jgi:(R,R)-butanediol dehydrogenase / meso-butanediol dehydrogenase / diacetyl reductase
VVVEPLRFCGTCRACRMGGVYLCYDLNVLGVDVTGGMQEYWAVPVSRLLKVRAALSDDHAALEPLAIATHDVSRAGVEAQGRGPPAREEERHSGRLFSEYIARTRLLA